METTIAECYPPGNSKDGLSGDVADSYTPRMPTIKETRRANFRALLARYEKQVEFAELCNLSPGHVSQMANGHRNIGDTVARRIERKLNLG